MTEPLNPEDLSEQVSSEISKWADLAHLQSVEDEYSRLNTSTWSMHNDPTKENSYYITSDNGVVMEGLSYETASGVLSLIRNIPEAIESFKDLSKMWNLVGDEALNSPEDSDEFIKLIHKYQLRIAQLEGSSAPVPEVSKASDLSFMHIGHPMLLPGAEEPLPIYSVHQSPEGFTRVSVGSDSTVAYLPPDMNITVQVRGRWNDGRVDAPEILPEPIVGEAPTEQAPEGVPTSPSDPRGPDFTTGSE